MTATRDSFVRLLRCACLGAILMSLVSDSLAQVPIVQPGAPGKPARELSVSINPQAMHTPEVAQLYQMLRLQYGLTEYPVTFEKRAKFEVVNAPQGVPNLELSTRSALEISFYLSKGVTVPEEHFACGLAPASRE